MTAVTWDAAVSTGIRRWLALYPATLILLAGSSPLAAQTGEVVEGRVYEAGTDSGIGTATVELVGHSVTLTGPDGAFRFTDVDPGGYTLNVVALGYAPQSVLLGVDVGAGVSVEIPLEISPIPIDPLDVAVSMIEMEGVVRDGERDFPVVDAQVLTNLGRSVDVDSWGRFTMENVVEGTEIHVGVRAFGYLPLDTTIVALDDVDHRFELQIDSVVQAMIDVQVGRLEDRADGHRGLLRPMNRDRLMRYAGSATLLDVLIMEYRPFYGRIVCGLIDERRYQEYYLFRAVAGAMPVEEVERIEFIASLDSPPLFMLRVYTREFMQDMISRDVPLRSPVFSPKLRPFMCR